MATFALHCKKCGRPTNFAVALCSACQTNEIADQKYPSSKPEPPSEPLSKRLERLRQENVAQSEWWDRMMGSTSPSPSAGESAAKQRCFPRCVECIARVRGLLECSDSSRG